MKFDILVVVNLSIAPEMSPYEMQN